MAMHMGIIPPQEVPAARVPPTVAAVAAFAARLARRHRAEAVSISRADRALASRPAGNVGHFHAGPRIGVFTAVSTTLPGPLRNADGFGEAQAAALFQRLLSRSTRVPTVASRAEPPVHSRATSRDRLPRLGAVERILPRSPTRDTAVTMAASSHPSQQPVREQPWGSRCIPSAEAKPITLAAPEVRRVADQVILEIDHRLAAQRERLGRR